MNIKVLFAFVFGAGLGALVTYKILEEDQYEEVPEEEDGPVEAADPDCEEADSFEDMRKVVKITRKYCPSEENSDKENLVYRKPNKDNYTAYDGVDPRPDPACGQPKPYVITIDEFAGEEDLYDKVTIYYYDEDDTIADENEEIVSDVESVVGGDSLLRFGEGSGDYDIVYVRNERIRIDYEVIRLHRNYQETVLGFVDEGPKRRKADNEG